MSFFSRLFYEVYNTATPGISVTVKFLLCETIQWYFLILVVSNEYDTCESYFLYEWVNFFVVYEYNLNLYTMNHFRLSRQKSSPLDDCKGHGIYQTEKDVTAASWRLKSLTTRLFVLKLIPPVDKDDIKALYFRTFVKGIRPYVIAP